MATYVSALTEQHSDGSEQEPTTVTLLIKNVQYFEWEVPLNLLHKYKTWQAVIDHEYDVDDSEQTSEDYYELINVISE